MLADMSSPQKGICICIKTGDDNIYLYLNSKFGNFQKSFQEPQGCNPVSSIFWISKANHQVACSIDIERGTEGSPTRTAHQTRSLHYHATRRYEEAKDKTTKKKMVKRNITIAIILILFFLIVGVICFVIYAIKNSLAFFGRQRAVDEEDGEWLIGSFDL